MYYSSFIYCINAVKAKVKVKVESTCVHHRMLWTNIIFIRDIDRISRLYRLYDEG